MIYSLCDLLLKKMLSNIRIIDILSYLIKYLQSCLRAIQVPLKIKPSKISGNKYMDIWISTKMHSLIYMCIIHFYLCPSLIQSMKNLILAILYLMAVILQRNCGILNMRNCKEIDVRN